MKGHILLIFYRPAQSEKRQQDPNKPPLTWNHAPPSLVPNFEMVIIYSWRHKTNNQFSPNMAKMCLKDKRTNTENGMCWFKSFWQNWRKAFWEGWHQLPVLLYDRVCSMTGKVCIPFTCHSTYFHETIIIQLKLSPEHIKRSETIYQLATVILMSLNFYSYREAFLYHGYLLWHFVAWTIHK